MNTRKILFILLVGVFTSKLSSAQISQADKAYDRAAYKQAIGYYEQGLQKDTANMVAWSKLADCYRRTGDSRNAERVYGKVINSNAGGANEHYFYILSMLNNQRYAEAKSEISKFSGNHGGDP
jgi:tetratricopeptide (TPR) repeat protein